MAGIMQLGNNRGSGPIQPAGAAPPSSGQVVDATVVDFRVDQDKGPIFQVDWAIRPPTWEFPSEIPPEIVIDFFQKSYLASLCQSTEVQTIPILEASNRVSVKDVLSQATLQRRQGPDSPPTDAIDARRVPTKIISIDKEKDEATVLFEGVAPDPIVVSLQKLVSNCPIAVCLFYAANANGK
jgi:hypothetical protein